MLALSMENWATLNFRKAGCFHNIIFIAYGWSSFSQPLLLITWPWLYWALGPLHTRNQFEWQRIFQPPSPYIPTPYPLSIWSQDSSDGAAAAYGFNVLVICSFCLISEGLLDLRLTMSQILKIPTSVISSTSTGNWGSSQICRIAIDRQSKALLSTVEFKIRPRCKFHLISLGVVTLSYT